MPIDPISRSVAMSSVYDKSLPIVDIIGPEFEKLLEEYKKDPGVAFGKILSLHTSLISHDQHSVHPLTVRMKTLIADHYLKAGAFTKAIDCAFVFGTYVLDITNADLASRMLRILKETGRNTLAERMVLLFELSDVELKDTE